MNDQTNRLHGIRIYCIGLFVMAVIVAIVIALSQQTPVRELNGILARIATGIARDVRSGLDLEPSLIQDNLESTQATISTETIEVSRLEGPDVFGIVFYSVNSKSVIIWSVASNYGFRVTEDGTLATVRDHNLSADFPDTQWERWYLRR